MTPALRQKPVVLVTVEQIEVEGRRKPEYRFYRSDGYLFVLHSQWAVEDAVDAHMPGSDIKYVEASSGGVDARVGSPPSRSPDSSAGRLGGAHF